MTTDQGPGGLNDEMLRWVDQNANGCGEESNSSPWFVDGPFIEIDGLPNLIAWVDLSMANCECHNQMVKVLLAENYGVSSF